MIFNTEYRKLVKIIREFLNNQNNQREKVWKVLSKDEGKKLLSIMKKLTAQPQTFSEEEIQRYETLVKKLKEGNPDDGDIQEIPGNPPILKWGL
jgi:hypothetical protein